MGLQQNETPDVDPRAQACDMSSMLILLIDIRKLIKERKSKVIGM